ncbi:MAG: 4-hydroxy-tetrahydrodipicolinate synthase [Pseudomonadota bacterium]
MYTGSIPALITPFTDNDEIDVDGFQSFVDWQIKEGSNALVPCGTTGESPTLSHDEHERVVELCVEAAAGRVPVIAGAGSNSTAEAIRFSKHAESVGANALLIVTPYYNKPTQAGLFAHYQAIHDACGLPIIIYNIPGRSVIDMSVETMARLAELPRIQGVKDATNDLARPLETRLKVGRFFNQLSGEDGTATAFLAQGGHGCISVTANVAPRACSEMHSAWAEGNVATMVEIRDRLAPLHEALFVETSPGPVKYAASLLGKAQAACRLPLVEISDETKAKVRDAMVSAGLLN